MPPRTTTKASKKAATKTTKKTTARKKPSSKAPAKRPTKLARTTAAGAKPAHAYTAASLMKELEKRGTAQNRKVYARHGAPENAMFGVSFADIQALRKQIKRDHDLAAALWASGNTDAQTLAALIADPERATRAELEQWAKSGAWCVTIDYLAAFVAATPHALPLATKWMKSRDENVRRAGYATVSFLLKNPEPQGAPLDTAFLREVLATIEREIHASPNRAREGMNSTLICIGVYHDALHAEAVAAAERIGFVAIDHGKDTNCKDVIAVNEIAKARAHRAKKASK